MPFCHRMSYYLFLLPIHYLLPTKWQCRLSGQLGNSYKSLSASPLTFATYFLYIVHLISIDLQLSRLFKLLYYKAYSNSSIKQAGQVLKDKSYGRYIDRGRIIGKTAYC